MTEGHTPAAVEDRARTLLAAKRYADAEAVARDGLVGCPDSALLHRLLSEALSGQERYEEARVEAEAACAVDPHDANAARNLSYRRAECGDRPGALEAARRGIALAPNSWTSHYTWAAALLDEEHAREPGALRDALSAVDEAARIAPANPNVLHLRGLILARLGRRDEARASYERSLAADPRHVGALTGLANLDLRTKPLLAAERLTTVASLDPQTRASRENVHVMLGNFALLYLGALFGVGLVVAMIRVLGVPSWVCASAAVFLLGLYAAGWWGISESMPRGVRATPAAAWTTWSPRQRRRAGRSAAVGAASLVFGLAPVPAPLTWAVLTAALLVIVTKRLRRRTPAAR